MQAQVDMLYEKYRTQIEAGEIIEIGIDAAAVTEAAEAFAGAGEESTAGYRYYSTDTIKELGIEGVEKEYLVNLPRRKVIALFGVEYQGTMYYTLEQMKDSPTVGGMARTGGVSYTLSTEESTEGGWTIYISDIQFSKYVGKGIIQYQKTGDTSWKTIEEYSKGDNISFNVKEIGTYKVKITDAAGEIGEAEISVGIIQGNYLVNGNVYANTLTEALAVENVSTIKVLTNVTEADEIVISKNITFDTNGKTVTCDKDVTVEETVALSIQGTGTIQSTNGISVLGTLNINDATITGRLSGTGHLIINSGTVTQIDSIGEITINGGNVENIITYAEVNLTINGGKIGKLKITPGQTGDANINNGTIDEIYIGYDSINFNLTIGDATKDVSDSQPQINKITLDENVALPYGENITINFYNGIIKNILGNYSGETIEFSDLYDVFMIITNVRNGYATQATADGITLAAN